MIDSPASGRRRSVRRSAFVIAANVLIAAVLAETILVVSLRIPRLTALAPAPFRRLIQQVYRHFNRSLIQFDPRCARYDPGVSYTLRPGSCAFENIEFRTVYRVNHAGLRDTEGSLAGPEVIVAGDSHAMGWGVEQDEAIPQLLARKTGLKVLNAAISSYGTAREMLMLDRLDTSRLRVLVVQYSDNDLLENRAYLRAGGRLPIMSEAEYQTIVRHYASQRPYYPGKYLYRLFMKVTRLEQPEPDQTRMDPASPEDEADVFLKVVTQAAAARLDAVQIVVFEIHEQIGPARPFIAALELAKRGGQYPEFIRKLKTVDVSPLLTRGDFYVLDDHMNPHGHEVVAGALAQAIRSARASN